MVQPWLSNLEKQTEPLKTVKLHLKASFNCNELPRNVQLAVEHPEIFTITLNGVTLDTRNNDSGYWVDLCCRTISIPDSAFVAGSNILELTCNYHKKLSGLETFFLLGDFAVKNDCICKMESDLKYGNIAAQGFPYYAGNITYCYDLPQLPAGKKYHFCTQSWQGVSLAVRVDGGNWIPMPC